MGNQGTINFGTGGGTLTTNGVIYVAPSQITGAGTINANGVVTDANLIFNSTHGTNQSLALGSATLNLNQTSNGNLGVGYLGSGSLTIADGVNVTSMNGFLGYNAGSTGTATISGTGSQWTTANSVTVGNAGTGSLALTNGGTVYTGAGYVAGSNGGQGTVSIDGAGTKWTNTLSFNVGQNGTGSVSVTNGGVLTDVTGTVAANNNSIGSIVIDGAGSQWINSGSLYAGASSLGTVTVTHGGTVSSNGTNVGTGGNGRGIVTVSDAGSHWTNSGALNMGILGGNDRLGMFNVLNGGSATASLVSIANSSSVLTADVGSSFIVGAGTGTITNAGTMRLVAGADAASGSYTPLSYGTLTGTGTVQALGGVWNATNKTVTVNNAVTGASNTATTADLSVNQRFLITDGATGQSMGAGFQAASVSTPLTMTATNVTSSALAALQPTLATGKTVGSAWNVNFSQGYTSGTPLYLSLLAGAGQTLSGITVYDNTGSGWAVDSAVTDLAYDGDYASFTATTGGEYALVDASPVPEPSSLVLLGSGLLGLAGFARRKFGV